MLDTVNYGAYLGAMVQTPEGKVKKKVVAVLKEAGVYYFFPATGGYGRSGVPDIIVCAHGFFLAIECKAGKNKVTALQENELNAITKADGMAMTVNEDNIADVKAAVDNFARGSAAIRAYAFKMRGMLLEGVEGSA